MAHENFLAICEFAKSAIVVLSRVENKYEPNNPHMSCFSSKVLKYDAAVHEKLHYVVADQTNFIILSKHQFLENTKLMITQQLILSNRK